MKQQGGFTLIEVLIAVLILAVGLLGTAALSLSSLQASQGASLRSQASALAADLAERIRANRDYAIGSSNTNYEYDSQGTTPTNPSCAASSSGCSGANQALRDLFEWQQSLDAALPDATAEVKKKAGNQYEIALTWSESGNGAADTNYVLRIDL